MVTTNGNGNQFPNEAARRTVQTDVAGTWGGTPPYGDITAILRIGTVADILPPWGYNVQARDLLLRGFWITEEILAGTIYTIAGRNSAFNFALRGPRNTSAEVLRILHEANMGAGWLDFIIKYSIDMATQDSGAFIEIIRRGNSPDSPVVGIANLDSGRCRRTGNWRYPVVYIDRDGNEHKLAWFQVIADSEFPSPIETMNGVGYCAVTRVLRAARFARDLSIYKSEKMSGRFNRSLHLITGFTKKSIEDQINTAQAENDNQGLIRYSPPIIITNPDPEAAASHIQIDLASIPDGFDEQEWFSHYIAVLALGFGADYQDLAPLPGGNLGTSTQSQILHLKGRGKGPALFMKRLQHKFNFHGVVPRNVTFEFDEKDTEQQKEEAELTGMRTRAVKNLIDAYIDRSTGANAPIDGIRAVALQIMNDWGLMRPEYLAIMGIPDASPDRLTREQGESVDSGTEVEP